MKYFYLFTSTLLFVFNGFAQTGNPVLISLYQSKVPEGKIWKIEKDKPLLVEFDYFDKYSMCGAAVQSNPGVILIRSGIDQPFQVHEIYFKNLKKSAFANGNTYSITPIEDVYFYPGTYLIVGTCLRNVQIQEYNLTKSDIEKKRLGEINIKQQKEEQQREEESKEKEKDNLFLIERAKTTYQLESISSNDFNRLKYAIKNIIIDYYKSYSGTDTLDIQYKLIFKTDTSGNQFAELIKKSKSDLDPTVINELKSLQISKTQGYGYFISTIAEYDISVIYEFADVKFRKYGGKYHFPKNLTSTKIKNLVEERYSLHMNGSYKAKVYYRDVMGKNYDDVENIK